MLRIAVILAVIILVAFAIWHPAAHAPLTSEGLATPAPLSRLHRRAASAAAAHAVVYVVGAVRRPGLYTLAEGARVDDAVRAAGGLRGDADPAAINLAARAEDGDEIVAPALGAPSETAASTKRKRSRGTKTHGVVDVNTASAGELASVPGFGATIAQRIVEIREQDGAFTTFDELLDVAGLTQSRLDRAQPYLRL
ncbi:MAG TPA: ComEA family DNA-binding protein [Candidatus Acidoferrales bacterium]|nr:ComEA family DNA-binding protein [Candidatus Acidoferrales bacterium]